MKISAEVLSVETTGDKLRLRLQGRGERDADWRPYLSLMIELPDEDRVRRAYYVGRLLILRIDTR